jgi:hypothetical protein
MASRSRQPRKTIIGIYEAVEFGYVVVSNADTVTIGSLYATANPYSVTLIKKTDGSAMTCTYAAGTNIVTITGAGTNVDCIYMAYGRKA